ncbi:MAG: zinc ribbon domain-containing protein [Acholeplasmatales bacterium]|jgi:uncharacterized membrane protein|nr:zinc ribbon domain-containing protein [Acholeplasmatales bacterium]
MDQKYCSNCGRPLENGSQFCADCGYRNGAEESYTPANSLNVLSLIGFILSFLQPIAGLIISIISLKKPILNSRDKNFSIAGLVISIVGVVGMIVSFFFLNSIINAIVQWVENTYDNFLSSSSFRFF